MKKFLTVLLALSVVFTYTVGTAFAVDATEANTAGKTISLADVEAAIAAQAEADKAAVGNFAASYLNRYADAAASTKVDAIADGVNYTFAKEDAAEVMKIVLDAAGTAIDNERDAQITAARNASKASGFNAFFKGEETTAAGYINVADYTAKVHEKVGAYDADVKLTDLLKAGTAGSTELADLYNAALENAKKDAQEAVKKYDVTKYTTDLPASVDTSTPPAANPAKGTYYVKFDLVANSGFGMSAGRVLSYRAQAEELISQAKKIIESKTFDSTTLKNNATAITAIGTVITNLKTEMDKVTTAVQEGYDKEDLALLIKSGLATLQSKVTAAETKATADLQKQLREEQRKTKPDAAKIAELQGKIAALPANYAALLEVYSYKINNATPGTIQALINGIDAAITDAEGTTNTGGDSFTQAKARAEKVAELKSQAELLKATIGFNGNYYYTAADVDKELEAKTADAYTGAYAGVAALELKVQGMAQSYAARIDAMIGAKAGDTVVIDNVQYPAIFNWDSAATLGDYGDDQKAEIKAIAKAARDAVKAAATIADAEKAFVDAYKKFDAVLTSDEHDNLYLAGGALKAAYDKYVIDLRSDAARKQTAINEAAKKSDYAFDDIFGAGAISAAPMITAMEAEMKTAYTASELDAKYAELKAMIDGLMTKDQVTAAKAAFDKEIRALSVDVKISDRDALMALRKSIDTFNRKMELTYAGTKYTEALLTTYQVAVRNLEVKALNDAYAVIGTVTLADKDAIEALRAKYDEYAAFYDGVTGLNATAALTADDAAIQGLEEKLSGLQVKDVASMIAKLDMNVTKDSIDAVKAARAAYDALTYDQKADLEKLNLNSLSKLEAVEKVAEKVYNEYLKDGVKNTTIKIYSKAYKKYTKISWKKSLGFKVDGYEVYRSTKKNTGFKKIWTAKSTGKSVKNTKNLISGKRYYYYAKGFRMLDGEKVYTKKSITIYRTAK